MNNMKKSSPYKKCPRCELNYIPTEESLCDVCKAELKLIKDKALLSDEEEEILCPICKQNYISIDDEMCLKCAERLGDKEIPPMEEEEEDWVEDYADEKAEEDLDIVSLSELEEKEKEFEDEEEDAGYHGDDFDDDFHDFDEEFNEEYDEDEEFDDEDEEDDF